MTFLPQAPGAALLELGYALAIGLLIGLERGWTSRAAGAGYRVAGVRTFGLLGVAGGVAGLLPAPVAVTILLLAGLVVLVGYIRQSRADGALSATSAIAALIVPALGMLATSGHRIEALAVAASIMFLLSLRKTLHGALRGLSAAELRAAARFAILTLVLLPLAPDRAIGPYGALNPHQLVLVVVLVTGLSFAGYALARRGGTARSSLVVAGLGAIVSSTAVTVALARRIRDTGQSRSAAAGIALASAISVARVGLLIALLEPRVLLSLGVVLGPAVIILLGATWWMQRSITGDAISLTRLGNPLELGTAAGLALLVAVTSVASRWALGSFGDIGVGGVLAIIGLADVDAAVLGFAALPDAAMAPAEAAIVLALPVLLNMVLKTGLTIGLAGRGSGVRAAAPLMSATGALIVTIAGAVLVR